MHNSFTRRRTGQQIAETTLSYDRTNAQGQAIWRGSVNGAADVTLVHLSSRAPQVGDQILHRLRHAVGPRHLHPLCHAVVGSAPLPRITPVGQPIADFSKMAGKGLKPLVHGSGLV